MIMESEEENTTKLLENRSYRQLQQMAKSMGLPSNFKKIYLIELILAKRFKSDTEVVGIIHKVREERIYQSKIKKRSHLRNIKFPQFQVSSHRMPEPRNSICYSPPITVTPKRPSNIDMQYSPEILRKAVVSINPNPKRNLMRKIIENQNTTMPPISSSDRVLRSYNLKTLKPNYALINNNIQEIKTQCCSDTERKFKIITNRGFPQFNVKGKCYVRKNQNTVEDNPRPIFKAKRQYIIPHGENIIRSALPAKRQRSISGIYPLQTEETVPRHLTTKQSVCVRKRDGSYTKINAVVQKCNANMLKIHNRNTNPDINIKEIVDKINSNIHEDLTNENNNYLELHYPNTSVSDLTTSDSCTQTAMHDNFKENDLSMYTQLDYENKVTTENLQCQRIWDAEQQKLPKINDAFSRFSYTNQNDISQPLYVQVGSETGSVPNHAMYVNCNTKPKLDTLYNIKTFTPFLSTNSAPTSTAETRTVYTTRIFSNEVKCQSTLLPANDALNVTSVNNQYTFDSDMRLQEFLQLQPAIQKNCGQSLDYSSSSSLGTMDTCASIPEMVEDALEIISQDGDYLERMGMNMRIQCVLCSWAGPKIILEGHFRKEHTNSIHKQHKSEWNITYTLESLVQCRVWFNRVIEYDSTLYMLSVKYEDPGCFMATLTSLSTEPELTEKIVSITLYNKITGEPFTWTGQIPALPPDLPYENNAKCLKVDLANLDLLPNSANLKLVNGELVTPSPNKVVIGHPALNDIHIIVFVRIFN